MKVAIVGSRKGVDAFVVEGYMDSLQGDVTIISGECPYAASVDQIAKWHALRNRDRFKYWPFPPDKARYGSPACFHVRNDEIVRACEMLVAFRAPGKSAGTDSIVAKAEAAGKLVIKFAVNGAVFP